MKKVDWLEKALKTKVEEGDIINNQGLVCSSMRWKKYEEGEYEVGLRRVIYVANGTVEAFIPDTYNIYVKVYSFEDGDDDRCTKYRVTSEISGRIYRDINVRQYLEEEAQLKGIPRAYLKEFPSEPYTYKYKRYWYK